MAIGDKLRRLLAEMRTSSAMALNIINVCQDDDASVRELASAVEADPSISMRLLRLANSPMFAGQRETTSIADAAGRVGRAATQSIAVEAALTAEDGHAPEGYWDHALEIAAATVLAAELLDLPRSDGFSTGLLADIGCYLINRVAPVEYAQIWDEHRIDHRALMVAERQAFSLDHCTVGHLALVEVGLPAQISEATRHHHDEPARSQPPLVLAACAGSQLADAYDDGAIDAGRLTGWWGELVAPRADELGGRLREAIDASRDSAVGSH